MYHILLILLAIWGTFSLYEKIGLYLAKLAFLQLPLAPSWKNLITFGWPLCIGYALWKIAVSQYKERRRVNIN